MEKEFEIKIPIITDDVVKVYFNGKYIGNANFNQVNKIRISLVEYIQQTGDVSILDKFYLIGHTTETDALHKSVIGDEIKVTMDKNGNLSDQTWELSYSLRNTLILMSLSIVSKKN